MHYAAVGGADPRKAEATRFADAGGDREEGGGPTQGVVRCGVAVSPIDAPLAFQSFPLP